MTEFGNKERAHYYAARAVSSVVFLEGGFIERIGLDSETLAEQYPHDFCECGGIPGELSEIAIEFVGEISASKANNRIENIKNHKDYQRVKKLAEKLNTVMGLMALGVPNILESAESRARRMVEDTWPAIESLSETLMRFGKLDGLEAMEIIKDSLASRHIEHSSMIWGFQV